MNAIPDLDSMSRSDLRDLILRTCMSGCSNRLRAEQWFPQRQRGFVMATRSIMGWVQAREFWLECLERGDPETAQRMADNCASLYEALPEWARWRKS